MILSFSRDRFQLAIVAGWKIHTFREDKHERWKEGMSIQFWRGNPRNVHAKTKPHQFKEGVCKSKQRVFIHADYGPSGGLYSFVIIDGKQLSPDQVEECAKNDGFSSSRQFYKWFCPNGGDWHGWCIHWTDFKYH